MIPVKERIVSLLSSPTRRRLAKGAFWGGVAAVGARGIAIVSSFFLARIIGQVGFGEYGMVNSTAGMISSMAGLGIGLTVTKHVAELKISNPERAGRIVALSSIVTMFSAVVYGIAFVALAPWLAEKTLSAPHLTLLLQISAITVGLGVINGVQTSSLLGCEAFKASSYISVSCGIAQSLMLVGFAWKWGIKGAVVAMAAGMVLTVFVTRLVVVREWRRFDIRMHWREALSEWRVLVHYSLPTFLTMLTVGPTYWVCNALLANQPNGYAELGVFNAASQWQGAIQILPGLVGTALVPVISDKWGSGDRVGSLYVVKKMIFLNSLVVIPIALVLCILSFWIMRGYGDAFASGYSSMILFIIIGTIVSVFYPTSQLAVASGQMWRSFFYSISWAFVIVLSSLVLVRLGSKGLATARLVATVVHTFLLLSFLRIERS